jgi:hypothetical protein
MKRILTVLALLTVCGMAFSVTGAIYVRYQADNTIVATEWGTSLEDLRVGRRGSGFDINTDSFGVSYKIRSPISLVTNQPDKYGNSTNGGNAIADVVGAVSVTSPGYIQLTSLKLGSVSADIGGAWWTSGLSSSSVFTNTKDTNVGVIGGTNKQLTQNYGYNYFAFNLDFDIPLTENIHLLDYAWDKIQFDFGTGSATAQGLAWGKIGTTPGAVTTNMTVTDPNTATFKVSTNYVTNTTDNMGYKAVTNDATSTHMGLVLPLHLDIGGIDPISIGLFPKLVYTSDVNTFNQIGATNVTTSSDLHIGALVRLGYKIDSIWSLYAHVGIDNDSTTYLSANTGATAASSSTNSATGNQLQAPLFIGIGFQPVGWVNLNVGLGYAAVLGSSLTTVNGTITNVTTTGGGFQETYGFFDEHAYVNPFFKFSGSTKFATDWEVGMSEVISMNGGAMSGGYLPVNTTSANGGVNNTSMFTFANNWNWDNQQCYIKYTKDAFSFQGMLGGKNGLAGLFAFVDASISF